MLNQVILVGKVAHSVQLEARDKGAYSLLHLKIESGLDSVNAEIIPVQLWSELAKQALIIPFFIKGYIDNQIDKKIEKKTCVRP